MSVIQNTIYSVFVDWGLFLTNSYHLVCCWTGDSSWLCSRKL